MRTEAAAWLALLVAGALAGCASRPVAPATPAASTPAGCPTSAGTPCDLPADVRAFVADRDLCDHFRGEPWPKGDGEAERQRRRELVEGVRTACAGTDRRLAELKVRYADEPRIATLLSRFEATIGD